VGARLLIYALGGGWGHLVRGLAFARAATRAGHRVRLLVNSPHADRVDAAAELGPRGELLAIDSTLTRVEQIAAVECALDEAPWDLLLVDTFPRGLGGELAARIPEEGRPCVWIHRDLHPDYVARYGLREFAAHYSELWLPGEDAPLAGHPRAVRTAPWLVRDPHERLSRVAAREALGVGDERPLVLVSRAGTPAESAAAPALAARLEDALGADVHVRCPSHWPLVELLPGADLLVGAGGYHTVHEARACGVPLLAVPRPRRYDRQARRLTAAERVAADGLVERARAQLASPASPPRESDNGVQQALARLEALLGLEVG